MDEELHDYYTDLKNITNEKLQKKFEITHEDITFDFENEVDNLIKSIL